MTAPSRITRIAQIYAELQMRSDEETFTDAQKASLKFAHHLITTHKDFRTNGKTEEEGC